MKMSSFIVTFDNVTFKIKKIDANIVKNCFIKYDIENAGSEAIP